MVHFHEGAGVGVGDYIEDFPGEFPTHRLVSGEVVPRDVGMEVHAS